MLNVECSIEHRELRIEHSLETRDTLHEERAFGRFRGGLLVFEAVGTDSVVCTVQLMRRIA
jgi:hypothetical protein